MTISDKIRIYELSRDLNLDNKDILDAAQKLSISVKSHSSSITAEDAKKIKNLINKKNSDKKILSINKPSSKKETQQENKNEKSSGISPIQEKPLKDNSNKNPLLKKPLNKPDSPKLISNQPKNINKPTIITNSSSKVNFPNQNLNNKPPQKPNQDKKTFINNTPTPPIKSPTKPPIQLIEKPKNFANNSKPNNSTNNIFNSGETRKRLNTPDQNTNKPKIKNLNNKYNTPELVGAPIRRDDSRLNSNKQNTNNKQNISYRQTNPNRPGTSNRAGNRPGSPNRSFDIYQRGLQKSI